MMKSAICATKMIHGLENTVPFEVGFDESATCMNMHPPPKVLHIGDGVTSPPQIDTAAPMPMKMGLLLLGFDPHYVFDSPL